MKKQLRVLPLFLLVSALIAGAQSGAVIPQGGAGHADQASCVILKRMGPADEVTSRLYSFGIRGKQFQYVEGKFPEGFPFHGRLTDHDLRNLQGRGAEVLILEPGYTADALKGAREECKKMTDKTPNQTATEVTLETTSTPPGADIELDGSFVGSTPSSVSVTPGDHTVKLIKSGYSTWERKIKITAGNVKISPDLEPIAPTPSK
jgi:hypothetical protein